METRFARSALALIIAVGLVLGTLAGPVVAFQATPEASPVAMPGDDGAEGPVDLDVLFIGAHPDDEAFGLAAYGQWNEYAGVDVGVITVTRGEGGGNAVGTEEGPALGLLREDEERRAVGVAGIEHVYNLDKVDFYYTVSAPLTEQAWDYEDTLDRVVRVVRATKPEVIVTMNPAPTPGNHGHHQVAARLAVDAFYDAANPESFPQQIDEGFEPWSVSSIYRAGATGEGATGPDCATSFVPVEPTDTIFGVWQGTVSEANDGLNWGQVARDGQRTYASQGWAVFPDAPTDPAEIECNYFTLIDSRVPTSSDLESTTAMLEGALFEVSGGLPLGTEFYLTADSFDVSPGQAFAVTAHVSVPENVDLPAGSIELTVPAGWEVSDPAGGATPEAAPEAAAGDDRSFSQQFTIVPAADAEADTRYQIGGTFTAGGGVGITSEVVRVAPAVSGVLEPLPEIAQFQQWADTANVPQLNNLILPVMSIAIGGTESVNVLVTNNSAEDQSGTVTLELPAGFEADAAAQPYDGLAAGESTTVAFTLTNTDPALATANQGGEEGTYPVTITTESAGGSSVQQAGINLVPSAVVPAAGAVAVDGVITEGEYTGQPLDLSRVWEGDDPDDAADASGTAWLAWDEGGIYVAVEVQDEALGTVLTPEDAKRHWRTDSVEIAIDPLGTAPNTSATFKVGIFPTATDGAPQAYRDADAYQGPVSETAPGFEVASALTEPYAGYVLETYVPFDALPAEFDPASAAMNIFIYDSDTQDLTGQSRLGWSTWNGVQGDPYRWGKVTLEGYEGASASPVAGASDATPVTGSGAVDAPVLPLDVAESTLSPQSIAQSAADGVPLAGRPPVAEGEGLTNVQATVDEAQQLTLTFSSGSSGTANYFILDANGTAIGNGLLEVVAGETSETTLVTVPDDLAASALLVSFQSDAGAVQALAVPIAS